MDKDIAKVLDWMDRWASRELIPPESRLQRIRETLEGAIEAERKAKKGILESDCQSFVQY